MPAGPQMVTAWIGSLLLVSKADMSAIGPSSPMMHL